MAAFSRFFINGECFPKIFLPGKVFIIHYNKCCKNETWFLVHPFLHRQTRIERGRAAEPRKGGSSKELFPGLDGIEDSTSIMKEKQKNSKNVSFQAKITNPAYHSRQKRRIQWCVIPGADHESSRVSFPGPDPESRGFPTSRIPACAGIVAIISSVSSLDLKIRSPLLNTLRLSFRAKKRPKTCHSGQKTPIQDHVIPGEKHEAKNVSFRAQTRNPGALKAFRIPAFAEYLPGISSVSSLDLKNRTTSFK